MHPIFETTQQLLNEIETQNPENPQALETFRITYLGTKGKIKDLMGNMATIPAEIKKDFGQQANNLKKTAEEKYERLKEQLQNNSVAQNISIPDLTAPAHTTTLGGKHPLTLTIEEITNIFERIGFTVAEGPEIEDDWHNFTALNIPENHPSRDMQDTFYLQKNPNKVLHTQTSSVQVRIMQSQKPPIRIISPGRVYRNESISARCHCQFHQIEGLYINENVSFAELRQTLLHFAQAMFGHKTQIRLRASYFPFTEPSAEVDITCFICNAKGCSVCKQSGWVEILGCGMVDPKVLEMCGIDPEKYTGFAFGMGVERIAMLKYQINDIRQFFTNDLRFLQQFKAVL